MNWPYIERPVYQRSREANLISCCIHTAPPSLLPPRTVTNGLAKLIVSWDQ